MIEGAQSTRGRPRRRRAPAAGSSGRPVGASAPGGLVTGRLKCPRTATARGRRPLAGPRCGQPGRRGCRASRGPEGEGEGGGCEGAGMRSRGSGRALHEGEAGVRLDAWPGTHLLRVAPACVCPRRKLCAAPPQPASLPSALGTHLVSQRHEGGRLGRALGRHQAGGQDVRNGAAGGWKAGGCVLGVADILSEHPNSDVEVDGRAGGPGWRAGGWGMGVRWVRPRRRVRAAAAGAPGRRGARGSRVDAHMRVRGQTRAPAHARMPHSLDVTAAAPQEEHDEQRQRVAQHAGGRLGVGRRREGARARWGARQGGGCGCGQPGGRANGREQGRAGEGQREQGGWTLQ